MCFVVFCGCFVMFCGCFAVFCECFGSIFTKHKHTKHPKTSKNTLENKKNSQYARVLREFSKRAKNFDCIAQNTFHKTSAKHRKTPQNTAKQSQNAFFVKLAVAKHLQNQNARKRHKTQNAHNTQYSRNTYCAHLVFSPKHTLDLSRKHAIRTQ